MPPPDGRSVQAMTAEALLHMSRTCTYTPAAPPPPTHWQALGHENGLPVTLIYDSTGNCRKKMGTNKNDEENKSWHDKRQFQIIHT